MQKAYYIVQKNDKISMSLHDPAILVKLENHLTIQPMNILSIKWFGEI